MPAHIVETASDARRLEPRFRSLHKIRSWLALKELRLPTLSGVIVTAWDPAAKRDIEAFASRHEFARLLLRTDHPRERPSAPRGGFEIDVADLQTTLPRYLTGERVVFLLEPRSPLSDRYSLGLLAWDSHSPVEVEIVGPGFDASDLKRGDTTPHESFSVAVDAAQLNVLTHRVVADDEYRDSWRRRVLKASRWFDLGQQLLASQGDELARARATIEAQPGQLLLAAEGSYQPIAWDDLLDFVAEAGRLGDRLSSLDLPSYPYMISASLFESGGKAYWDIVWPHLKYDV